MRSHTSAAQYARARRLFRRARKEVQLARSLKRSGRFSESVRTWVIIAKSDHRLGLIWLRGARATARHERHRKKFAHLYP